MKRGVLFFFKYYLFWLAFFLLFKGFFLLGNYAATAALPAGMVWKIFCHGFVMDLSAAGYCTLLVGLCLALMPFIPKVASGIIRYYTLVILILLIILGLVDIQLYPSWGCRVNSQIIPYVLQLQAVFASVSWLQCLLFAFFTVCLTIGVYFLFIKKFKHDFDDFVVDKKKWTTIPLMLFFTAFLVLPIRGGIDTAPLNYSSVYFSENLYANNSAYNFFWGFCYSLLHNRYDKNPVNYMSSDKCVATLKGVDRYSQEQVPQMMTTNVDGKPVNVVMVILESFSDKIISNLGGRNLTPRLDEFSKEGICFKNFYATGSRSDRGLSSLLAGYPALIKASSILGFPNKMRSLDYLPAYFARRGYDMSFYYGGDVNFYNMNIMMIQGGVKKIVARPDFPIHQATMQKWGVPDEYLYGRLSMDVKKMRQPFFTMVYNISSHEPFDIPQHFNRVKGQSSSDRYCNSVAYTDSCLGVFIDNLRKSPLWKNTLVIITSDHTSLLPEPQSDIESPASYKIPMIWIGGVVKKKEMRTNICSQTDLSATLVQQMGWKFKSTYFSKNMFGTHEYAFFFDGEGWGILSPNMGYFQNIDTKKKRMFWQQGVAENDSVNHFAQAFTQFLHDDFIKR